MNTETVHVQLCLTDMRGERFLDAVPQFISGNFLATIRSEQTVVLHADGAESDALDFNDSVSVLVADDSICVTDDEVVLVLDGHLSLNQHTSLLEPVLPLLVNEVTFSKYIESLK